MRSLVASLAQLAGAAAITAGVAVIWWPAGLIVGGALSIVFGYMAGGD